MKIRKNTIGAKMKIFPLCVFVCLCVCLCVCLSVCAILKSSTFVSANRNTKRWSEKLFSKYQRGKEKKILPVVEKILQIPTGKRKLGAWLRKFSKYQRGKEN